MLLKAGTTLLGIGTAALVLACVAEVGILHLIAHASR